MPENKVELTEAGVRHLMQETARAAARETVEDMFAKLGIDADAPFEVQRDFQHLREWRKSIETVKRQGMITAIGIIVAGVLGLIWMAIKGNAP